MHLGINFFWILGSSSTFRLFRSYESKKVSGRFPDAVSDLLHKSYKFSFSMRNHKDEGRKRMARNGHVRGTSSITGKLLGLWPGEREVFLSPLSAVSSPGLRGGPSNLNHDTILPLVLKSILPVETDAYYVSTERKYLLSLKICLSCTPVPVMDGLDRPTSTSPRLR